jgi:TolB-like protein/DNA-binding SARP family transcriptional activator
MLRLRTLGGAVVEDDTGPVGGAAAQRKSLALLALLAPGRERGMSRDKIVTYLWPEAEPERAAHRLTQLVYALRRDLGTADLVLGTIELRLNSAIITSDVAEFGAARRAGELEQAVSIYGGPFLDGFYLTDSPEFERWVENERVGFAREYAEALETLAAQATVRGDHRQAAAWWRRLANHDPLSSRVMVHLMSTLAAGGSRGEAIEQARAYQDLIRRELDAEPNPAIIALAEQLRQRPVPAGPTLEGASLADVSIAVLPFTSLSSAAANNDFAEGLSEELMSALTQVKGLRVIAASAVASFKNAVLDAREVGSKLGARVIVEGTIRQAGDRLRLTVRLVDASDGCYLWSERYERRLDDVFAAQDQLTQAIIAGLGEPLLRLQRAVSAV